MTQKKHSFRDLFSMVKDGKLKSTFFMYSFALSFLFLIVYGVSYLYLIDPIENLFRSSPVWLKALMESFLPALAATIVCVGCQCVAKNKRIAAAALVWLSLYALLTWILMLCTLEAEEYRMFIQLFLSVIPFPLLLGGGATISIMLLTNKRTKTNE